MESKTSAPKKKNGGRRPGAGRKKGIPNRMTTLAKEQAIKSGITPLEYMLSIMRDERQSPTFRAEMAKAAAPYVHPRLATIEHNGKDGGPIQYTAVIEFV